MQSFTIEEIKKIDQVWKRVILPYLSLPCGRVLNPLPSPRPFQKGKGCNRPPVLGTATL